MIHQKEKESASNIYFFSFFFCYVIYYVFLNNIQPQILTFMYLPFSYSENEYFKQTLRQGAPAKPKEPRIPRMPHL